MQPQHVQLGSFTRRLPDVAQTPRVHLPRPSLEGGKGLAIIPRFAHSSHSPSPDLSHAASSCPRTIALYKVVWQWLASRILLGMAQAGPSHGRMLIDSRWYSSS
ncbi:hypothetical protein LIA77_07486 [Sarocladium implicatum]|nr:hypothetical protein LIA77_07486 [Sarocladium implicatum]